MFKDFFIRTTYPRLAKEFQFYLQEGIQPEIYIDNDDLAAISAEDINKYAQILGQFSGHTVHAPFYDISTGGFNQEIRALSLQKMERIMEMAKIWQTKLVVMHFNFDPIYYGGFFKQWLENSADFFKQLLNGKKGPLIALENIAESTPEIPRRLVKKINSNRIIHCFDLGHHHVFGSLPFAEWLLHLEPVGHLHLHFHDNNGRSDSHNALGDGTINWFEVKQTLLKLPVDFTIALELHRKSDLLKSLKFYRQHFL